MLSLMCGAMRAIFPCLLFLWSVSASGPAQAMNWEGHDDWMADMAPAVIYEGSAPPAAPHPAQDCRPSQHDATDNPYEQIPLDRPTCPEKPAAPAANR